MSAALDGLDFHRRTLSQNICVVISKAKRSASGSIPTSCTRAVFKRTVPYEIVEIEWGIREMAKFTSRMPISERIGLSGSANISTLVYSPPQQ